MLNIFKKYTKRNKSNKVKEIKCNKDYKIQNHKILNLFGNMKWILEKDPYNKKFWEHILKIGNH